MFVIADSIVGVTLYAERAPDKFETFCRAFVSMFRITVGSIDWWSVRHCQLLKLSPRNPFYVLLISTSVIRFHQYRVF